MNFINVGTKFLKLKTAAKQTTMLILSVDDREFNFEDEHSVLPIGRNAYCFRVILLTFHLESVGP